MGIDLARRTYSKLLAIAANTPATNPAKVAWVTEDAWVHWIELYIPRGANGYVGTRLMKSTSQVFPFLAKGQTIDWVIGDDFYARYEWDDYMPTTDLSIQGFNTGNFQHTVYWRINLSTYNNTPSPLVAVTIAPGTSAVSSDPLSPDAILGAGTVSDVMSGAVTPSDAAAAPAPAWVFPPPPNVRYRPGGFEQGIFTWDQPKGQDKKAPRGYFYELINHVGKAVDTGFTPDRTVTLHHIIGSQDYDFHVRAALEGHGGTYSSLQFKAHVFPHEKIPVPNQRVD